MNGAVAPRRIALWPRQTVPWGDQHLPLDVAGLLRAGLLRREWCVYSGRNVGDQTVNVGGSTTIRIPVSNDSDFEWLQTMSDTRAAGGFRASVFLERPAAPGEDPKRVPFFGDQVAWESISGTGAQPYWFGPMLLPAGSAVLISVVNSSTGALSFNAYLSGCRLVR